jgi:hypothetical protein
LNLLIFAVPVLCLIIYLSSLNWRRAIVTALILVVLEGALRKWVLPQASQLIYFLKDFVLLGAYLSYFKTSKAREHNGIGDSTISFLVWLMFGWCIFEAFNTSLGSPIIGFIGLKNFLFYIPLMWMLPAMFQTEEELYRFLRFYLLLLIPVALLAIAQFFSPPESPLNVYAWGDKDMQIALGGDLKSVRVTGTFSYIAGYSVYLATCFSLILPLISLNQSRLWQLLTVAELMLIAITSFMTGARGMILTAVLLLGGYFFVQGFTDFSKFLNTFKNFLLPGVAAIVVVSYGFQSAVDSLWLRVTSNQDMSQRVTGSYLEPFNNFQFKGLDGFGVGATFQANPLIRQIFGLPAGEDIPVYYESEMGRIALEIGPVGFFLWYGLKLVLLVLLFRVFWSLKRPFLKQLALSAFLIQSINFSAQLVFNQTANLYYWFFYGFIYLLPQLERISNLQESQYQAQRYDQS